MAFCVTCEKDGRRLAVATTTSNAADELVEALKSAGARKLEVIRLDRETSVQLNDLMVKAAGTG